MLYNHKREHSRFCLLVFFLYPLQYDLMMYQLLIARFDFLLSFFNLMFSCTRIDNANNLALLLLEFVYLYVFLML